MKTRTLSRQVCRITLSALLTMSLLVALSLFNHVWASGDHGPVQVDSHAATPAAPKSRPRPPASRRSATTTPAKVPPAVHAVSTAREPMPVVNPQASRQYIVTPDLFVFSS